MRRLRFPLPLTVVAVLVALAVALAPAASAQVAPPTLTGETFLGGLFVLPPGQSSVTVTSASCNPSGTSTFTYRASGPATGPYIGTYSETGTVSIGPQIFGGSFSNPTGLVTSWTASFTITGSPFGTVTGSKSLLANVEPPSGICTDASPFGAQRAAGTGLTNALAYTASITVPGGAQYSDHGTSNASVNEEPTSPNANSFYEDFASPQVTTTPICDENSQGDQNQILNDQGCKNP